jgi:2-dehydro-3-deoxyglucarate aldolase
MNPSMQFGRDGKPSFGSWITIGDNSVAEIMARAGFEWLVVDMEHSAITTAQALDLIRVADLSGVAALVRVPANDPVHIKRALDAGAHGVIVPMVNSADEARAAVEATRYPPEGTRGVGLARAQGYGFEFDEYKTWQADGVTVIVQIEHVDAIDNLEAIVAVPGVDGTMIGPYDLSASLGHSGEYDLPVVAEALTRYEETSKAAGCPMGYHIVWPDEATISERVSRGYTILALGVDEVFLGRACRDVLDAANGLNAE